ncbi:MAG: aspartate aminotransferase family protein [Chitinophagia bacterium]|nr:aspartate aminotransferase family protein [Chitinophagia bacterium]NDD16282.1 aspartate aminotransferase family protein [Chitinophagia bacterium]
MSLFQVYPLQPIAITKALGSHVWDDKGTKYLDMYGGHAVISIGHTHPHWVKRIEDQLHAMAFYSNSVIMPIQEELAIALNKLCGKLDYQLFLCNSGAEANENALKLASFHTGRKKIIAFSKAFHGRTSLAVAATDNPSIIAPVNETDNIIFLPFNDVEALTTCFAKQGKEIAGVIIEGIQGVAGIYEATNIFLQTIRTLCDKYGTVYIADSVQCGYGRSGKFFAHDFAGVNADIYSMAKGMGNGFPIGGILIAPSIKAKFGLLGTTFGGNPLACAAALAVLEVMEKDNLMETAAQKGKYLIEALANIKGVKTVRGKGLMIGFEMEAGLEDIRKVLLNDYKIFTGEAKPNVIRLLPSLSIGTSEIDLFLKGLKGAIQQLSNKTF